MVGNWKVFYNQGKPIEKYHNVEKTNRTMKTKNIITNFSEKLRNLNIDFIFSNNSDYLEAHDDYNRVFIKKIV